MTAISGTSTAPMGAAPTYVDAQQAQQAQASGGIQVPGGTDPGTIVPGVTVSSPGGSTTIPNGSVADYSGATNPGDAPDSTYKALSVAHVAVFRAMGTPEDVIAELNQEQPDPAFVENYLTTQVFPNPEAWDAHVGNPPGTARAGLAQLIPNGQFGDPTAQQTGQQTDPNGGTSVTTPGATFAGVPVGGMSTLTKFSLGGAAAGGLFFAGKAFMKHHDGVANLKGSLTIPAALKVPGAGLAGDAANPKLDIFRAGANAGKGGGAVASGAKKGAANAASAYPGFQMHGTSTVANAGQDAARLHRLDTATAAGVDHGATNLHRVGLLREDYAPLFETANHYGIDPMELAKFHLVSTSLNSIPPKQRAKIVATMAGSLGGPTGAAKSAEQLGSKALGKMVKAKGLEGYVRDFDPAGLEQAAKGVANNDEVTKLLGQVVELLGKR